MDRHVDTNRVGAKNSAGLVGYRRAAQRRQIASIFWARAQNIDAIFGVAKIAASVTIRWSTIESSNI